MGPAPGVAVVRCRYRRDHSGAAVVVSVSRAVNPGSAQGTFSRDDSGKHLAAGLSSMVFRVPVPLHGNAGRTFTAREKIFPDRGGVWSGDPSRLVRLVNQFVSQKPRRPRKDPSRLARLVNRFGGWLGDPSGITSPRAVSRWAVGRRGSASRGGGARELVSSGRCRTKADVGCPSGVFSRVLEFSSFAGRSAVAGRWRPTAARGPPGYGSPQLSPSIWLANRNPAGRAGWVPRPS
jgi:hypothetical protein